MPLQLPILTNWFLNYIVLLVWNVDFLFRFSLGLVIIQNEKEEIGVKEIKYGYIHTKPAFPVSCVHTPARWVQNAGQGLLFWFVSIIHLLSKGFNNERFARYPTLTLLLLQYLKICQGCVEESKYLTAEWVLKDFSPFPLNLPLLGSAG